MRNQCKTLLEYTPSSWSSTDSDTVRGRTELARGGNLQYLPVWNARRSDRITTFMSSLLGARMYRMDTGEDALTGTTFPFEAWAEQIGAEWISEHSPASL